MKQLSLAALALLPAFSALANPNEVTLPRYGGYGSGSEDIDRVCVFTNIVPLYSIMPQKAGDIKATGGGLGVQLELGVKVPFKMTRGYGGGGSTFLSFSLGYQLASIKTKYTDALGNEQNINTHVERVVLPIAIGGFQGNGRARFYWQGGVAIGYTSGTASEEGSLVKSFNPVSFTPFVSLGVSGDGQIKHGPLEGRNAKGMVGPFLSYTLGNLSSASNTTVGNYVIGIQFTTVFL